MENADVKENALPLFPAILKTNLVELAYRKAWTGSFPLCTVLQIGLDSFSLIAKREMSTPYNNAYV